MEPAITVLGGGTGSFHVLSGLRQRGIWCRAVVAMTDSGGDSGVLRDAFGVLPPGDVRRCLVALSEESETLRELFSFRFDEKPLEGRSFGNLFLLALTKMLGSEEAAIEASGRLLGTRGEVIPVTRDHAHLVAVLEDGTTIHGEGQIDGRGSAANVSALAPATDCIPIRRVYLEPKATATQAAIDAIESADIIVLAPGDMYTSTLANILVDGVPAALQRTKAKVIYAANLMTKSGETDGWSASRHVATLIEYSGRIPDAVLAHDGDVPEHLVDRYRSERAFPVGLDEDAVRALGVALVHRTPVAATESFLRHDPDRTAAAILDIVEMMSAS